MISLDQKSTNVKNLGNHQCDVDIGLNRSLKRCRNKPLLVALLFFSPKNPRNGILVITLLTKESANQIRI